MMGIFYTAALGVTFLCVTYTTCTTLRSSYFSRTKKMDNVVISHSFMQEVEVKGEIECSSRCSIHPTCNMVFYKSNTNQCRLFNYNPNKNETLNNSEWKCLRRTSVATVGDLVKFNHIEDALNHVEDYKNDLKRCGAPPDLVNAEVTYENDLVGSQASYACKADFRQCGDMNITCQSTQRWGTPSGRCERYKWIDPEMKFSEPIPCGEQSKLKLIVTGVPTRISKMSFEIKAKEDILFLTSIRFAYNADIRKVVFNSYINNNWGAETKTDIFPFEYPQRFFLEISLEEGIYHVFGNGKHISTLPEVKIGGKPDNIMIENGVSLEKVVMEC